MRNLIGFYTLWKREVLRFLKVINQTILPPLISNLIFVFIFGFSLGSRIPSINGIPYVSFIVPGLIMLALINSAYQNTGTSLFIGKWWRHIQEVLVSPLSYFEMVLAYTLGGVVRGLIVGILSFVVIAIFIPVKIFSVFYFIYFMTVVSIIFSSVGLIVGLWAEEWEHLAILTTFVITPLTFFGGVFHSIRMLPDAFQTASLFNPFFYMIDGFRYSMTGNAEGPLLFSVILTFVLMVVLFYITVILFKKGYKLRT